ncbi:MAG TPA: hypothetical protein VGM29_03745 [Polyangiaceae bacterium]
MTSEDADLAAIVVPPTAKFGGGALLLLGVLTLVLCLQTVLVVGRYNSLTVPIISAMFLLGASCAVLGFQITRGSGKAAVLGAGFASITCLGAGGWFVFGIFNNLFSLLALMLMPIAVTAILFVALSIGWARRADLARERLRAQGLDSGL